MKKVLLFFSMLCIPTFLNFGLFSISYNKLATPYLHESQRTDNAEAIIFYVLPAYALLALLSFLLTYFVTRKLA